jgi:hypothetical protein
MRRYFQRGSKFVALALLWLVPGAILFSALHFDWNTTWRTVGIHGGPETFLDLRTVPAALRTLQQGMDPLVSNPSEALGRPFNYPRIWLYAFSLLRINEQNVWIVGLLFCAVYLLCVARLILERDTPWQHWVLLFGALSVAGFFAIERGNNDLFIFAVVFAGCAFPRASRRAGMLLAATILKLFPLVALLAEAMRQRGKNRIWSVAAIIAAVVILGLQYHDLALIRHGTPASLAASYGVLSMRETLWYAVMHYGLWGPNMATLPFLAELFCWLAGLGVAFYAWKRPYKIEPSLEESREAAAFFIFGTIYVSTFAVGSNWDYRLIFLIPTLPLAFEFVRQPRYRRWSVAYIIGVLLADNIVGFDWGYRLVLSQGITFAVFLLTLVMLVKQLKGYIASGQARNEQIDTTGTEAEKNLVLARSFAADKQSGQCW